MGRRQESDQAASLNLPTAALVRSRVSSTKLPWRVAASSSVRAGLSRDLTCPGIGALAKITKAATASFPVVLASCCHSFISRCDKIVAVDAGSPRSSTGSAGSTSRELCGVGRCVPSDERRSRRMSVSGTRRPARLRRRVKSISSMSGISANPPDTLKDPRRTKRAWSPVAMPLHLDRRFIMRADKSSHHAVRIEANIEPSADAGMVPKVLGKRPVWHRAEGQGIGMQEQQHIAPAAIGAGIELAGAAWRRRQKANGIGCGGMADRGEGRDGRE